MRLVFAGTQSVGKTTLVEDLERSLDGYRIEEEPIRAVARLTGEPPPTVPTRAAEARLNSELSSRDQVDVGEEKVWTSKELVERLEHRKWRKPHRKNSWPSACPS